MPDRSRKPNALPAVLIAFGMVLAIWMLALASGVTAQDSGTITPAPTSEFDLNLPATVAFATATLDPGQIPSLTGVGGQAAHASVVIRSGPGLSYAQIGYLPEGDWIDIVGWSGWTPGRICSSTFANDLDMWVQVQAGNRRGWIARCVLTIRGRITDLPIVSADGERSLQR